MMDTDKQRQMFILLITGIAIVVIISIFWLIVIWTNRGEKIAESKEYKLGQITQVAVSAEDYVKKYFNEIEELLIEEDFEKLFDLVGEDYLEYSKMTEEKLKEYVIGKKVTKQNLELKSYEKVMNEAFNNVYVMNLKLKDGIYDINIVVREKAPNEYTIAFENYIVSNKKNYNNTMNGINLSISNITYFSNYIVFDLVLKNVHDDTIIINSKSNSEDIFVKLADGSLIAPYNTVLGGRTITIEKDRIKQYNIWYSVTNETINTIESIVIKNVYYNGAEMTSSVEFVL